MKAFSDAADAATTEVAFARAPGMVNLIGDHTDYNDGLILPAAIDLDTWMAFRPRRDGLIRMAWRESGERAEFWTDELAAPSPGGAGSGVTGSGVTGSGGAAGARSGTGADPAGAAAPDPADAAAAARSPVHAPAARIAWSDYVAGMAWSLRESAIPIRGFDGVIDSTIPRDAGLGWVAALELASAIALLAGERLVAAPSLAALAQRAERDYLGVDGGIADQFASAAGRAGRAILLDCRSLESRYVVLPAGVSVVICDTGSTADPRTVESALRDRRADCGRAVALLAEKLPAVASLRDLDSATLRRHRQLLSETVARRAEHVVGENERVVAAVAAFDAGNVAALGRIFAASHESLGSLFEVSSPALDAMVEIARSVPGVVAARMTGVGFDRCTVNLVRDAAVPAFERAVAIEYPRRTGLTARVYAVASADGAGPA
jgi:galactokinase